MCRTIASAWRGTRGAEVTMCPRGIGTRSRRRHTRTDRFYRKDQYSGRDSGRLGRPIFYLLFLQEKKKVSNNNNNAGCEWIRFGPDGQFSLVYIIYRGKNTNLPPSYIVTVFDRNATAGVKGILYMVRKTKNIYKIPIIYYIIFRTITLINHFEFFSVY